jgi:hypothetical protein
MPAKNIVAYDRRKVKQFFVLLMSVEI